ncbi:MAG: DNA recombination protein RmuC, partial [Alphaproteobacteria bacterium]|nr:DNA recombination protein RmuC [Alphaproteobacteria bacterium]
NMQLRDLVQSILPPSAYSFEAQLTNGRRVDCLLRLPNPPGAIAVDAKFPLESYQALRAATDDRGRVEASAGFRRDVLKHVKDIAERYIVPGETAESALMFLPSEAIYAELHANFVDVVQQSFRARVWIVSPTTLMATLNTVRAVLKDANMRAQAAVIQEEVQKMLVDVKRLGERVSRLQQHIGQTSRDVDEVLVSTKKIADRGQKIVDIELGENAKGPVEAEHEAELEMRFTTDH